MLRNELEEEKMEVAEDPPELTTSELVVNSRDQLVRDHS